MRKKKRGIPFEIGQSVTGMKVLERIENDGHVNSWEYFLQYECCGDKVYKSHKSLKNRISTGYSLCLRCRHAEERRVRAEAAAERKRRREQAVGAYDTNGVFWPSLGPMGFRQSSVDRS